jgi:phosphoglucosamine mutase
LQLLAVIKESGKKLSDLSTIMTELPQVLVNAKVKGENRNKYKEDSEISAMIEALEIKLKDRGRVLIRPSGTEPLIRVMLEGENKLEIQKDAEILANLIQDKLG